MRLREFVSLHKDNMSFMSYSIGPLDSILIHCVGWKQINVTVIHAESPFHRLPKNCAQQESAQRHAHTKWSGSSRSVDVAEQQKHWR